MPIATPAQYGQMLDAAAGGGWALPAVNVTSSETLNAAIRGFAEAGSDGIVQVTTGAADFLAGSSGDMATGARALAEFAHIAGEHVPVLVGLHTDHATPDKFDSFVGPLVAESRRRRERGQQPLFNSHMFDGSTLTLGDNLRRSEEVLAQLAPLGVLLELEVGVVGGEEDGVIGPSGANPALYTSDKDLIAVAQALGAGERGRYLVAATFGNVHGVHANGGAVLKPEILAAGQAALAAAYPGRRFQYVFHGSSGSSVTDIRAAIANGVVKVNLDTDAQYAYTRAIADHLFTNYDGVLRVDGNVGRKAAYDPRTWGRKAEAALAMRVAEAAELFGSAERSLLAS
jgi:fructose-bisphosphate aldolase class II